MRTTRGSERFTAKRTTRQQHASVMYVVRPGDTLIAIADKHNVSWRKLYRVNRTLIGSNPSLIRVGMHLHVPTHAPFGI